MIPGEEDAPLFGESTSWEDAQAALEAAGLSDGLPLVVPTQARLDRMVAGQHQPEEIGNPVPPLMGELTLAAVAYNGVLAGCVPAELPVVMAAVIAALAPDFNLLGIATTTGTPTVAVCVHGPVAAALGMNSGTNCLGPGNRANACIGRAVRLVQQNLGGARPGIGDMATMGSPGKYGLCFAEGAHPLLPSLAMRRGVAAGRSAVTVFGVSGTLEVLPEGGASTPEQVLRPLVAAMRGAREAASGGKMREPQEQVLLIPNEMSDVIAKGGWDLARAQEFLFAESGTDWPIARAPSDILLVPTGGEGVKMTCLVPWGGGTMSVTRALH